MKTFPQLIFGYQGDPVFADSKILTMTHVQICVRNPEVVVAYFLPR